MQTKECLRCYVCGGKLAAHFFLVVMRAPSTTTSRAFLICSDGCLKQIDERDLVFCKVRKVHILRSSLPKKKINRKEGLA